jgi:hypothetical protein
VAPDGEIGAPAYAISNNVVESKSNSVNLNCSKLRLYTLDKDEQFCSELSPVAIYNSVHQSIICPHFNTAFIFINGR